MRIRMQTKLLAALFAILAIPMFAEGVFAQTTSCTFFASPNGTGNGLSPSSPFKIANFWRVARPGYTLCLLDGVYTGSDSMISPPEGLNGTARARITIKALNDGKVRINGRGVGRPVQLKKNDYFLLEGFDAHDSSSEDPVVQLGTSADYNIVRRVCAWNVGGDIRGGAFSVNKNTGNLLEDVCGFGVMRKVINNSQNGNNLIVRRAWGRWERSLKIGPKMTFSIVYNSYNAIYENVIGTWDEAAMAGAGVNQPYGILSMDTIRWGTNFCANSKYLGSIGYIRSSDEADAMIGVARSSNDVVCMEFKDVVSYIEPGAHTNIKPFSLSKDLNGGVDKVVDRITEIGGKTSSISSQWKVSNWVTAKTVSEAPSIWNGAGSKGARVCKRYVNGVLTNEPLWPWPMNQRIIDAMKAAGKKPVDVTRTMEEIFGPIPSECTTSSSGDSSTGTTSGTPPSRPKNLRLR